LTLLVFLAMSNNNIDGEVGAFRYFIRFLL